MRKFTLFALGLLVGVAITCIYIVTRPAHQPAQQQVETVTPIVVDLNSLSKDQREILARGLVEQREAIAEASRKAIAEFNSRQISEGEANQILTERIAQAKLEHPYPPAEFFEDLGIADEMLKGRPVIFRRTGVVDPLKRVDLPEN